MRQPTAELVLSTKTQSFDTFCSTFDSLSFVIKAGLQECNFLRCFFSSGVMSLSLVPFKQAFSTFLVTSAHADISLCVSVRMQVNSSVLLVKHKFYCHINVSDAFWSQKWSSRAESRLCWKNKSTSLLQSTNFPFVRSTLKEIHVYIVTKQLHYELVLLC